MGSINNKMLCMLLITLAHARRMYQIRKFQEAELKRRSLRPCNATDLAQGLRGTWRLSPFARGDQYGWDKAESERLRKADASEAYERPVHEYLPDQCRLRRFDARDAVGRCFSGRRLAFVGDSLAEQVSKALLGMLGHAGHAAAKTEHGDVFSMDRAPSKEEFVERPKKRHPRYWKQRDFRRRLTESGMEVLERFKLGRVDLDRLEDIDETVNFGPRDVILISFGPHYKNASRYERDLRSFCAWVKRGRDRKRATLIWRENSATHFPVSTGTHEEMMRLNYDGGCPPYAENCLTWPLKCSSHALTYDEALPRQRWRNDVLQTVVRETSCGSVLPLFELVRSDWRAHPGSTAPVQRNACDGAVTARQAKCCRRKTGAACLLDCLHLAPKYNHLTARLLYHLLCFASGA